MKRSLMNQMFRNLLSAIVYGVIYAVLSFVDKGYVEFDMILISTVIYFGLMCLLCFIAPRLRKITGHDKDDNL